MSDLEKELSLALQREEPPEGFAERVLARVAEEPPIAVPRSRRRPRILYGFSAVAAAAAVAVFTLGTWRIASPPSVPEVDGPEQIVSIPPERKAQIVEPQKPRVVVPLPAANRGTGKAKRRVAADRPATPRQDGPSVAEAQYAREQLMLALRIASDSLGTARRMVLEEPREPGT